MTYPNVPQASLRKPRATFADWGAAYKVALGVMAVGVLVIVLSPFAGGLLYTQAIAPLIEALSEAEGLSQEPETGVELLALLGGSYLIVGICMFMVRLVLELLGLAGAPALTRRMRDRGKLAVGAGAAGAVVFTAGALPGGLISLLFDDHAYAVQGVTTALDVVSQAGGLLMLCSLITLFLWRRNALLRWTDAAGWGSVRCGWVNRLALAMVAGGIIGLIPFMPFHDVANVFASAGVVVLVLGIVPQMMAG